MGGKRPDQHNIDPAEGSSTNHTWRGEGRSADEHIENEYKQEYQGSRKDSMIPERGMNPAQRELGERKTQARQRPTEADDMSAGAGSSDEDADAKVDEASRESFPASDPPAMP